MIIFDLEALADDSHRRHFIDPLGDHPDYYRNPCESCRDGSHHKIDPQFHKVTGEIWHPDYEAYYDLLYKDRVVNPVEEIYVRMRYHNWEVDRLEVQLWSDRSQSLRDKTEAWLENKQFFWKNLKMRSNGDTRPKEVVFEEWIDHRVDDMGNQVMHDIHFAFSSHKPTIDMFRRRGIFVFDCNQGIE